MALIKSISGIRGTIGGKPGEGLTPVDVVKYTAAYGTWLLKQVSGKEKPVVVESSKPIKVEEIKEFLSSKNNEELNNSNQTNESKTENSINVNSLPEFNIDYICLSILKTYSMKNFFSSPISSLNEFFVSYS